MKWITKIDLQNYRAFGNDVPSIDIPHGSHLLIYGENGSGKSSLYGALRDFLNSANMSANQNSIFEKNRFAAANADAFVKLDITEDTTNQVTTYNFNKNNNLSTHRVQEIQLASKIKGFLDYKRMLKVHALDVPQNIEPNIFEILISNLLSDYLIPDPYGTGVITKPIKETKDKISKDLCNNSSKSKIYEAADSALNSFNTQMPSLLTRIFTKTNEYLGNFYFNTDIVCDYNYVPLTVIRRRYLRKKLNEELYLGIRYKNVAIRDYHYFLNEARLSAIAMSLHLAAIKVNTVAPGILKVLCLDDVFIGMDTGNRLPLLKILENEFINPTDGSEPTQIVLSTYDRHWFEVIQRHFEGRNITCKKYELYRITDANNPDRPLVLPYETNFDKAIEYLRNSIKPDYPAAANYFRKYAEDLLQTFLPDHEIRDRDNETRIKEHKLGKYIDIAIELYQRFGWNYNLLVQLKNALPTLLHPLSHFELSSPIYKEELEEVVKNLLELKTQFTIDKNRFQVLIPPRSLMLKFSLNAADSNTCEIVTDNPIYIIRDNAGVNALIESRCTYRKSTIEIAGNKNRYNDGQTYSSLTNAYTGILNKINAQPGQSSLNATPNVFDEFKISNAGSTTSIQDIFNTFQW